MDKDQVNTSSESHGINQQTDVLACPACIEPVTLSPEGDSLTCENNIHSFTAKDGILRLLWPQERVDVDPITDAVREFYEETPFPNYEPTDTLETIRTKAYSGVFAPLLDE